MEEEVEDEEPHSSARARAGEELDQRMDAKALSKWRNPGRVLAAARALERSSRTSIASPATAPGAQKTSKHQHRAGLRSADSRAIVIDWSAARPPSP